jgi:hypothetical protein
VALRELASTLAETGELAEARSVAAQAVRVAYGSPQAGERAASDALVAALGESVSAPESVGR